MGTCYQAQVEVFNETCWQAISSWDLQKDYSFSIAWYAVATRDWPKDMDTLIAKESPPHSVHGYDLDHMLHGDGALFVLLTPEEPFPWFHALKAHVQWLLDQGYKTRVLTWGA